MAVVGGGASLGPRHGARDPHTPRGVSVPLRTPMDPDLSQEKLRPCLLSITQVAAVTSF